MTLAPAARLPAAPPPPHRTSRLRQTAGRIALDSSGNNNHLALRSNPPLFVYSTAPLAFSDGRPVALPLPGAGGYSLALSDQQDCVGGCFDSATGGAGRTSPLTDQEYGPQDFYGVVEEMRLWRVVRTPEEIRQSMAADDGRGPGGFVSPGIDPKHPDLVAYYNVGQSCSSPPDLALSRAMHSSPCPAVSLALAIMQFDEGAGYVVKDISGNGNDLLITQPPTWEVTRWLSTCGNAVVEGLEECDDGDLSNGDGCSAACVVEPGWKCSGSPSICVHSQDRAPIYPPNPDQAPSRRPEPSGGDGGRPLGPQPAPPAAVPSTPAAASAPESQGGQGGPQGGGHSKGWIAAVVIGSVAGAVALSAVGVAAFLFRRKIADTGAQVATSVGSASSRLTDSLLAVVPGADGLLRGRQGYSNTLTYDPTLEYAPAGAPDFMAMSPAPRNRAVAPGTPGAYQSLVGSPLPPQAPRSNSFV
ncbi:hypothetical protein QJQ45_027561 [Haematococcus lacustris]|nr:hypothetical protein QJQ45_027561 [Haematococcus lacustris]